MKGLGYKALSRPPSCFPFGGSGQSALWLWHVPCTPYGVLAFANRGAVEGRARQGL